MLKPSNLLGELLVDLTDLERAQGLHEAGAVVRAGSVLVLDDLLRELAVELGAGVAHLVRGRGVREGGVTGRGTGRWRVRRSCRGRV